VPNQESLITDRCHRVVVGWIVHLQVPSILRTEHLLTLPNAHKRWKRSGTPGLRVELVKKKTDGFELLKLFQTFECSALIFERFMTVENLIRNAFRYYLKQGPQPSRIPDD
jgi:hypothetical protein